MTTNRTLVGTKERAYTRSHPWLTFELDLRSKVPFELWVMLGECQSKCEHLGGIPLKPKVAKKLHLLYLAKGTQASAAIEGNSLTVDEVEKEIDGKLSVPPSREYLKVEVANLVRACNEIANKLIVDDTARNLSAEQFHEYNEKVLRGITLEDGDVPGAVSSKLIGVGKYAGAPREDCNYLLARLAEWLNKDWGLIERGLGSIIEATIKAIMAHLYLVWIHPWRDGNGRTARLTEFHVLASSGVPTPACHLLSNFYNQTRTEYYKQLDAASHSGDIVPLLCYAVRGFRDGLRETIHDVKVEQMYVAWENYVHEQFRGKNSSAAERQRHLVFDLTASNKAVSPQDIASLTPRLAKAYATKTEKTVTRDLNRVVEMALVKKTARGYLADWKQMEAFVPRRAHLEGEEELFDL